MIFQKGAHEFFGGLFMPIKKPACTLSNRGQAGCYINASTDQLGIGSADGGGVAIPQEVLAFGPISSSSTPPSAISLWLNQA